MKAEVPQTIPIRRRDIPIPQRCENCPYPRVGFFCHDQDGDCLRTDMEQLTERQKMRRKMSISC